MRILSTKAAIAAIAMSVWAPVLSGAGEQQAGAPARILAPIPLEEAVRYEFLSGLQPSPDRRLAAFTLFEQFRKPRMGMAALTPTGVSTSFSGGRIRLADVATGRVDAIADDKEGRWVSYAPSWSPDGAWLAFISDRDGHPRIWRWERKTGRIVRVSDAIVIDPTRRHITEHWRPLQWTPDGRAIVARVLPEGMEVRDLANYSNPAYREKDAAPSAKEPTVTVYPRSAGAAEKKPGEPDSVFMVRQRPFFGDLASIEVETGAVTRCARRVHAERYDLAPDGQLVAFFDETSLRIVDRRTGRQLASDPAPVDGLPNVLLQWSPASDFVLHVARGVLRRVDLSGSAAPVGTPPLKAAPVWSPSARAFLAVDGARILRLESSGPPQVAATLTGARFDSWLYADEQRQALFSKPGVAGVWFWTRTDDGQSMQLRQLSLDTGDITVVDGSTTSAHDRARLEATVTGRAAFYLHEDATHAPNYWVAEPGRAQSRRITHANAIFERYVLGEPRLIEWTTDDGDRRRGAMLLPAGYKSGQRVPMVVWVYGDTRSVVNKMDEFGVEGIKQNLHLLATRGYAVLVPESVLNDGTPMLDLAKNVLPGVSRVVELGIADERRLGIAGHSYGGYSTLSLVVQTPRFRAAIASAGLYNMLSYWGDRFDDGESESIKFLEEPKVSGNIGQSPWQAQRLYIENSPFFYLDRVTTPLLLVHGDLDPVPVLQSDQVYFALRRFGKPVEYARYREVGHSMSDAVNELDLWRRIVAWFDGHLKSDTSPSSRE